MTTDFSVFDHIDIDVDMNEKPTYSGETEAMPADFEVLTVEMTTDFTITNAEGKSLIYQAGRRTGDMTVYNSIPTIEGENAVSSVILYVEPSEKFVFEPASQTAMISLSISNDSGGTVVNGLNIQSVEINENNEMTVNGIGASYEINTNM